MSILSNRRFASETRILYLRTTDYEVVSAVSLVQRQAYTCLLLSFLGRLRVPLSLEFTLKLTLMVFEPFTKAFTNSTLLLLSLGKFLCSLPQLN